MSPSELGLVCWSIWCPGVLADVKYRDSVVVLGWYVSKEVHVWASVLRVVPGFPDTDKLHNDLDWICGLVGQCHKSGYQCPVFGLAADGYTGECAQPFELPQRHGMSAKSIDPHLTSQVVGGGCGIERESPPSVLVKGSDW